MADQNPNDHGKMDIDEQESTFAGFMRLTAIAGVVIVAILIFLALVNA